MTASRRTLMVMAGGTGGHVLGLAVAHRWKRRAGASYGRQSGDGSDVVPKHGIPMEYVRFGGLRGGAEDQADAAVQPAARVLASLGALRRVRPDVVLGWAATSRFPAGVMTALSAALVLHEQNSIAGLANKVLAKFAKRCCRVPRRTAARRMDRQPDPRGTCAHGHPKHAMHRAAARCTCSWSAAVSAPPR
jgi:UDP-N-acetylglucosamine--N-acetylmuramyl-(pentapeptide) pyrophosphoryl-undecaprenol N-acetylglucosamine transferase